MVPFRAASAGYLLLLIFTAVAPARAVELNAPGVSVGVGSGGASASVGAGGASAGASVGGGSVDAEVSVGAGDGGGAGTVTETIDDAIERAPAAESAASDDNAGLGTDAEIIAAFESLAAVEQEALRERCGTILRNPTAFTDALVAICRLIAATP